MGDPFSLCFFKVPVQILSFNLNKAKTSIHILNGSGEIKNPCLLILEEKIQSLTFENDV